MAEVLGLAYLLLGGAMLCLAPLKRGRALLDSGISLWLVVLVVVTAAVAALAAAAESKPRVLRKPFLTENEARVLTLLEEAMPQHRIMAQVAMGGA